jgi:hypothetical protein
MWFTAKIEFQDLEAYGSRQAANTGKREFGGQAVKPQAPVPLCIELFCGMFGWSQGWLEMGGRAVGFDIEHLPHHGPVPKGADLVIQDVLTLHGSQFRDADLILASPPCQEFSYRALPWKRAKALPPPFKGMELFNACYRIQAEACEAANRHIPMIIENVRGAQKWIGQSRWNYGSYYLWGNMPALMPHGQPRKSRAWFSQPNSSARLYSGHSPERRAWSAKIAKIPLPLSRHIAQIYFPHE